MKKIFYITMIMVFALASCKKKTCATCKKGQPGEYTYCYEGSEERFHDVVFLQSFCGH